MMDITFAQWSAVVAYFVTAGGFAFTLYRWLEEKKSKRDESARADRAEAKQRAAEERQAKAEKELAENRSRAEGPRLIATELVAGKEAVHQDFDGIGPLPPDGTIMRLAVANTGAEVDELGYEEGKGWSFELFRRDRRLRKDAVYSGFFHYPFRKTHLGFPMKVALTFTTSSGARLTHVYEVTHGRRQIQRIDPP